MPLEFDTEWDTAGDTPGGSDNESECSEREQIYRKKHSHVLRKKLTIEEDVKALLGQCECSRPLL